MAAATPPGALVEAATWCPQRTVDVEGWRVGLSHGLTRRANSVLPVGVPSDLLAVVELVERTYASAGLPAVFRVCRAARPAGLESVLADRGYRAVAHTDVLVRALGQTDGGAGGVRAAAAGGRLRVLVEPEPSDAWLSTWLGVKGHADTGVARAVLEGSPAAYLTVVQDDRPLATLRAAFAEDWVGLSCLVVVADARRRGLARELALQALAVAGERGARRAFLQVEVANSAAARLYADLGFRPAERYHYRELSA
ncbi:GNAT family N-acetyltransferase [Cellulomonas soli]